MPNVVYKSALPSEWIEKIRPLSNVRLTSSSRHSMKLVGLIPIFIKVGVLKVRVWLGATEGLLVSAIIEKKFIYSFSQAIFPAELKLLPLRSREI